MENFIIGVEPDGSLVAISLSQVVYLHEDAVGTKVYLIGGATITLEGTIEGLGFAVYRQSAEETTTAEGATPS